MKLNNKQLAFVEEYLANGMNATQAYLKAYPNSTYATARNNGAKTLAKDGVQELIDEKKKEMAAKAIITKEELLADLKYIKELNKDNPRSANSLKAIEIINKMLGFNLPIESNINMIIEQPLFGPNDEIDKDE